MAFNTFDLFVEIRKLKKELSSNSENIINYIDEQITNIPDPTVTSNTPVYLIYNAETGGLTMRVTYDDGN